MGSSPLAERASASRSDRSRKVRGGAPDAEDASCFLLDRFGVHADACRARHRPCVRASAMHGRHDDSLPVSDDLGGLTSLDAAAGAQLHGQEPSRRSPATSEVADGVAHVRRTSWKFVALACVVAAGCSESPRSAATATAPTPPAPDANRVWFTPDDLMTDVASTPMFVNFAFPPTDVALDSIRATIAVRTYPGRRAIPFSATLRTAASAGMDGPPSKYIDIVPQASVAGEWIVLSLPSLPDGFASGSAVPNNEPDLGIVVARIHGGSAPIVRSATLAAKVDTSRFSLALSEPVTVTPASVGNYLRVSSTSGTPCTVVPVPRAAYTPLDFDCPGSSQRVHLEMHPGLQSAAGVPLGILKIAPCDHNASPVGPAEFGADLDFANAAACSTGCKLTTVSTTASCTQ
jgi:hypothetical protein